ncbi:hypothetical protein J6590_064155 [Homalodisca vitripennis]|nr:hypothetical protein J6590_064155 [Homalodisca vitripennis]
MLIVYKPCSGVAGTVCNPAHVLGPLTGPGSTADCGRGLGVGLHHGVAGAVPVVLIQK